jgi:hypothetical protein
MSDEHGQETELSVTIYLQFPNMHRDALAKVLAPVMETVVAAGGTSTSIGINPVEVEPAEKRGEES